MSFLKKILGKKSDSCCETNKKQESCCNIKIEEVKTENK